MVATTTNGVITGFGSVIVNGVKFETDATDVDTDDDDQGNEDDLEVGMVVTISGTVDEDGTTGDASEISYDEEIQGPIDSVDLADESFVILG